MGHGICDTMSKSQTLSTIAKSAVEMNNVIKKLFKQCNVEVRDLRGVRFYSICVMCFIVERGTKSTSVAGHI